MNIRFGTRASALLAVFSEIIIKMYHLSLEAGAPGKAISVIFYTFVERHPTISQNTSTRPTKPADRIVRYSVVDRPICVS